MKFNCVISVRPIIRIFGWRNAKKTMRSMTMLLCAAFCAYGQFSGFKPPSTPLLGAAASGNTAAVKELLKSGVNPNEGKFAGLPPVMFPLMMQNREMVQVFIEAKVDLKVR